MTPPKHAADQNPLVLLAVFVVIGGVLLTVFRFASPDEEQSEAPQQGVAATPTEGSPAEGAPPTIDSPPFRHGMIVRPDLGPDGPEIVPASTGRSGTGMQLRQLPTLDLPVGPRVEGQVAVAVANIPHRAGIGRFARSIRRLTNTGADFVVLNEVGRRSINTIRDAAPGYDAYRDPHRDIGPGSNQSMQNVILWRTDRWTMVDAGRVKLVENDRNYFRKRPVVWDRYATWGAFQRADGAIVSVIGTHMMTNPAKFPRQHGNPPMSRIQQYAYGMDVLRGLVSRLSVHGPVLVGGDMNSHTHHGAWSAHAKMRAHGYSYAKDSGVMYLFYPAAMRRLDHRQFRIASDHPAILTQLDLNGVGPS